MIKKKVNGWVCVSLWLVAILLTKQKQNKTIRSLKKDEVNEYKRKKYHERKSKFEEKVIFKRIDQKYNKRERRLKATIDDTEIFVKRNRKKYRKTGGTKGTKETGKGKKK